MVGLRLMRLIDRHAEELAMGLTVKLRQSDRTTDFRRVPVDELQTTTAKLYRNLGEWLLKKTEKDIEQHLLTIAQQRAAGGVRLPQFVWAVVISRNHLYQFLLGHAFADSIFELYNELELQQLLNNFFERATYYGAVGYEKARQQDRAGATTTSVRQIPRTSRLRKVLSRVG